MDSKNRSRHFQHGSPTHKGVVDFRTVRSGESLRLTLRHLFKQETGTTPGQYLKAIRLKRAATLLRTTFMSVKEIAMNVGLTTASYFVREFRKSYGMTLLNIARRAHDWLAKITSEQNE
jgi:AraC-like DNA-binding protein